MAQRATPIPKTAKPTSRATSEPRAAEARLRPQRDFIETVWMLFCSVKFAVVLNVALALTVMLGTVIPQMQPGIQDFESELSTFLEGARARYGDLTGFLYWAGFFDLYNSLWFRMLVVFVIFGIIICTMNRWQPTLRLITRPTLRTTDSFLAGLTERAQFRAVPVETANAEALVTMALRKSRYRVLADREGAAGVLHLYADRDRWSKMVTFFSHAALVLLILSAALFAQMGWRERSVFFVPGKQINVGHGTDFSVANLGFDIEYYEDGTTVKEYRNTLGVYEGDTQVLTKTIIVNDPLGYKGVNFFLVSYMPVLYATARDTSTGTDVPLRRMGASGPISDTNGAGEALLDFQFSSADNLPMDLVQLPVKDHILTLQITYYQDVARGPNENPPAFIQGFVDKEFEKPVFEGFLPRTGPFSLPGYEQYQFSFRKDTATVLEVAQDPGLGLVGFWFVIMTLGFTLSLYTTFTRCWVKISPNEERPGTVNIVVGGMAEKNKVAFERDFEKLATRIRDNLSAGAKQRPELAS
jgi:cytochrome c biogenesis protein